MSTTTGPSAVTLSPTMIDVAGVPTSLIDTGQPADGTEKPPVLMLHGSGPGVTAAANWRPIIPAIADTRRVLAFDQMGFGGTADGEDRTYGRTAWTEHALALLDELGVPQVDVIGNSMGGAIAMSLAVARPTAIRKIVLMGSMGVAMALPEGLEGVWRYRPSMEESRRVIGLFAYNSDLITDDLVSMRYRASLQPQVRTSWEAMFPAPRQRWVDDLALSGTELASVAQPVLLIHGRDDKVVPWSSSAALLELLPDARMHIIGGCGHWTMIERTSDFLSVVQPFLAT